MRRVDSVFSVFEKGFSTIKRRRVHPEELERRHREESARKRKQVIPVLQAPRGVPKYRHQSQRVRTLSRGLEAAREYTPQNVRSDTPFITSETVQSVKMKFFIEKTGSNFSEKDAQYSEEYKKRRGCVKPGS